MTSIKDVVTRIEVLAGLSFGAYVCVSNVHMCIEAFESPEFNAIVNGADIVIPDGRPLSWAQTLLGCKNVRQVRGQDIMASLCEVSGGKKLNIGLYGGSSDELLARVQEVLINSYPDITICYSFSPPFRPLTLDEDNQVVDEINQMGVDILFVGIGCPKQERWMAEHKSRLSCVMLGVGAAFDFIAGEKAQAPRWVQAIGMEWLFRLVLEPRRLWRRYLITNPKFVWYFFPAMVVGSELLGRLIIFCSLRFGNGSNTCFY